jgi:hypothetical protein
MVSTMTYMVSLEDGEIVKMTADGFQSTGMFLVDLERDLHIWTLVRGRPAVCVNA